MTAFTRIQDALTARLDVLTAVLCLAPTVAFLLVWHMQVDMGRALALVTVPAVLGLIAAEMWMATHAQQTLRRLCNGLVAGLAATVAFDMVRFVGAYLFHGAPDYVPMIGQHLLHETIGIAPTLKAVMLGYGYHYLLMGAMLGAGYALLSGRAMRPWGFIAALAAGCAFSMLPQFQLMTVAMGFSLEDAASTMVLAFGVAGVALETVMRRLNPNAGTVTVMSFIPADRLQVK